MYAPEGTVVVGLPGAQPRSTIASDQAPSRGIPLPPAAPACPLAVPAWTGKVVANLRQPVALRYLQSLGGARILRAGARNSRPFPERELFHAASTQRAP